MSLLTCRKIAVLKFILFVLHEVKQKAAGAHFTSSEKASSVPGRTHTAVVESSGAANPRVPVLKLTVLSLSPTLAGRDLTWCKPSTSVVPLSNQVTTLNHKRFKGFKMFSDG